jgi:hypothetical protein
VFSGEWGFVVDKDKIPVTITTDRGTAAALRLFVMKYPSIAQTYRPGETLVAVPDLEASKSVADFRKQKEAKWKEPVQNAWWNN